MRTFVAIVCALAAYFIIRQFGLVNHGLFFGMGLTIGWAVCKDYVAATNGENQ